MKWRQLTPLCRVYLGGVYLLSLPFTYLCFSAANTYSSLWIVLTVVSIFVSTVNVRLPKISSVVSMGDVFTILALTQFGPGPGLITYWLAIFASTVADVTRRLGMRGLTKMMLYRFAFNLACCAISIWIMFVAYGLSLRLNLENSASLVIGLAAIALAWFASNTLTVSLAISLWSNQSFLAVWREGITLYLLNFSGSAAVAGLILIFYKQVGFFVLLLALPIAVVLYQLYLFYIDKYEQARNHVEQLNSVYLQTIEAMAGAVDAKDPYTHGHIRRVQVYAVALAKCIGITDDAHLLAIQAGALLHDIGKIAIPEYILNKPTVLTETEFDKMKIHPVVGANMLKGIEFPFPVEPLVKSHHERWDGRGYPDGLIGEEVPIGARLLSVVDCYDALTTNRPYRAPMPRKQLIEFFQREAGRAYDPAIVDALIKNLPVLEDEAAKLQLPSKSPWELESLSISEKQTVRPLERVQPVRTYDRAMKGDATLQRDLYSVFEFARTANHVTERDILVFMGAKLENLVTFDAAVFYVANLDEGIIQAKHVLGSTADPLKSATLRLEQKLSGWVAANNQSLTNLPPFPDFLTHSDPKPQFENSCIVPLNKEGVVLGALALYRKEKTSFTDEEFRRTEILASQTSLALNRIERGDHSEDLLVDPITGVANGFHLYLMFDQVATDADKYQYPLALVAFRVEDLAAVRRKYGIVSADESLRAVAKYVGGQMRDSDILVRYSHDEFLILAPKLTRENAHTLISRLQNDLDHYSFRVRSDVDIPLPVSMGLALYPEDGTKLESLIEAAEWRLREDQKLRVAVKGTLRTLA